MADVYGLLGRIARQQESSRWMDGTGTTTVKNRQGEVLSITRNGKDIGVNKYSERLAPFVANALAGRLPAKELGR